MKKTVLIGPGAADLVSHVENMPKSDEDFSPVSTGTRMSGFGWVGAKLYEDLKLPYVWAGTCGQGVYGDFVRLECEKEKLPALFASQEMNGCSYTLVDRSGNCAPWTMPGAEYLFTSNLAKSLDLTDVSSVQVSGSMLNSESYEEILHLLRGFGGHIMIAVGPRGAVLSESQWQRLNALGPMLYATSEEAWVLTGSKETELGAIVDILYERTHGPVLIRTADYEVCYAEGERFYSVEIPLNGIVDLSGCDEAFAAAFMAARSCGVHIQYALQFASQVFAWTAMNDETTLRYSQAEEARELLRQLILG